MKQKTLLQKEKEWRYKTGHAYAENIAKLPISESARKYWSHKPYGYGGCDVRTVSETDTEEHTTSEG